MADRIYRYKYEPDQLIRMRKIVDRSLAYMEAIQKNKITPKNLDAFKVILPAFLKMLDKLHASKTETKETGERELLPIFIQVERDDVPQIREGFAQETIIPEEESKALQQSV